MTRLALFVVAFTATFASAQDLTDRRQGDPKNLNGYFPFTPPKSKADWDTRWTVVREQLLVANGLWPLPAKTPLQPVIHGKIDRGDYTVEKVFFASYPGHYVCGNLYRPTAPTKDKRPAILSPHGHWANGRFFDAGDNAAAGLIKSGAEQTNEGAHYPLQARCAQLARMGCVVFFYDMVGYADSKAISHRDGFNDIEAELRLQSFMGLQTWNSVRALDFLLSLPDVDAKRIGVTGASGGGTQTFILCAIDDRPAVAVPAVMVSTGMQGGCICENCSLLRIGTGNVEIAALTAPRPLGLIGANDWTKEMDTKGYPELKELYKLLQIEDRLANQVFKQFPHNYNQVSREFMYTFFNQHLKLGQASPVKERPFKPVPPKELSVFDDAHPVPADSLNAAALRASITRSSDQQLDGLSDAERRTVTQKALRAMIVDELPAADDVEKRFESDREEKDGVIKRRYVLSRKGQGEAVRAVGISRADFDGTVVVWVHPDGPASLWANAQLTPAAKALLDKKMAIVAIEPFRYEKPRDPKGYAGYLFGYNRPLLAERVHDILTAVAFVKGNKKTQTIHLAGFEKAGPSVILARGLCGDAVSKTIADANGASFAKISDVKDELFLPGALRYGDLPGFMRLLAGRSALVHNTEAKADGVETVANKLSADEVGAYLLKR